MGVDCCIRLPGNVRVQDVAYVIGIAAGLKPRWEDSSDGEDKWLRVDGIEVKGIPEIPSCCFIDIKGDIVDDFKHHHVMFHFEPSRDNGRLLMPRSSPFWIAIGKRLVDFFGGTVDYSDCDDVEVDYSVPHKSDEENKPEDEEPWHDLQKRLSEVKPLTMAEIDGLEDEAAYSTKNLKGE